LSGVLAVFLRFAVVLAGYAAACLAASAFVHVLFLGWSGLAEGEVLPAFTTGMMVSVPLLAPPSPLRSSSASATGCSIRWPAASLRWLSPAFSIAMSKAPAHPVRAIRHCCWP
jgi:hypothetical protein